MSRSIAVATILVVLALDLAGCESGTEAEEAPLEAPPVVSDVEAPVLAEPGPDEVLIEEEEESLSPAPQQVVRKKPAAQKVQQEPAPPPKGMRRARLGKPSTQSRVLDSGQIKRIISERIPQVRACYERELKKNSGLAGKVLVAWTIREDGSVTSPKARTNTTGNRALVPCITKAVSKWRFPKSGSPSDVEFPFVFRSKEDWR